ncbi:MAG: isochorismatase family cysteine hydrolase [Gemmatimonadales bacterium]|nr:isochorismatase family cysteine hydrolase [Gemmatimonadales bacterium]
MATIHWDVDTQHDFIAATGLLSVPDAEAILPTLARLTAHAHASGIRIVATADDHDIGHAEISDAPDWKSTYPPHCMRGTPGQAKVSETALRNPRLVHPVPHAADDLAAQLLAHDGDLLLLKPGTDVFRWNPNADTVLRALAPSRVVVYGVATDVCVVAAVDGLARRLPDAEIVVVQDAVAALDPERGRALLAEWSARGISVISSAQLLG